jgi:WhiB family redox-sensing transcriptional regulator
MRLPTTAPPRRPASVDPAALVLAQFIADATGAWGSRALCGQTDPDIFFSDSPAVIAQAKDVCRRCLVRDECLAHALRTREEFGVWGGLDRDQRRRLRRASSSPGVHGIS